MDSWDFFVDQNSRITYILTKGRRFFSRKKQHQLSFVWRSHWKAGLNSREIDPYSGWSLQMVLCCTGHVSSPGCEFAIYLIASLPIILIWFNATLSITSHRFHKWLLKTFNKMFALLNFLVEKVVPSLLECVQWFTANNFNHIRWCRFLFRG